MSKKSTFAFTLPLQSVQSEVRPGDASGEPSGMPKVVLVEDDRPSLDLFGAYLEGAGIELVIARDGEEGLESVRTLRPAAVVPFHAAANAVSSTCSTSSTTKKS